MVVTWELNAARNFFLPILLKSVQQKNPGWPGHVNAMGCFPVWCEKNRNKFTFVCVCVCVCVSVSVCVKNKKEKGKKKKRIKRKQTFFFCRVGITIFPIGLSHPSCQKQKKKKRTKIKKGLKENKLFFLCFCTSLSCLSPSLQQQHQGTTITSATVILES